MLKKIAVIIVLVSFPTSLIFAQPVEWIPFRWVGEDILGRHFDKASMIVPVTIDNLPYKFNMQFDLGAVTTIIYGNSIAPYLKKHRKLKNKIDSTLGFIKNNQKFYKFKSLNLRLGKVSFGERNIGYYKGYGVPVAKDSIETPSPKHIGTIASDLFRNEILIIDYPNQRICTSKVLPKQFSNIDFLPVKISGGMIKIPFNINGSKEDLLFDTGTSLVFLMTTKQRANSISNGEIVDSIKAPSWGVYRTMFGKEIKSKIKLGKVQLKPAIVYYNNKGRWEDFYKIQNIWGIVGNSYFLNDVVIIDYKHKKFGIRQVVAQQTHGKLRETDQ